MASVAEDSLNYAVPRVSRRVILLAPIVGVKQASHIGGGQSMESYSPIAR
jgi:hypothetical protein